MAEHESADTQKPCGLDQFCRWAGGCEDCRPETWRAFQPELAHYQGTAQDRSYEDARHAVRQISEHLRSLAFDIDTAMLDGFRLYDVINGKIYLCKGRVKRP
ncbi:MAG: hypothetical protein HOY79_17665 [Streptomyces sp.]|nr:hypothetical protein [Streptomyces sp.]